MSKTAYTEPQWQDLSLTIHNKMPVYPGDPKTRLRSFATFASGPYQASQLSISCHAGTHMDAPRHFLENGLSVEAIDLNCLVTEAWVTDVQPDTTGLISLDRIDMSGYRTGDALILSTGWEARADHPHYYENIPVFADGSAQWLKNRGVKLLGLDLPTVAEFKSDKSMNTYVLDNTACPVDENQTKPVMQYKHPELSMPADQEGMHKTLLGGGVIILESLVNLKSLRGKKVQLIALPLRIAGAEGSPVRACAKIIS